MSDHGVKVGKRTFVSAIIILACLIIVAGVLTYLIPGGEFQRDIVDGREIVVPGTFRYTETKGFPVWRWFTAPVEVLWGPDSLMIITIILFILIIGGAFAILDKSGVLATAIGNVAAALGQRKYLLLGIITLLFMLFGSVLGILEEIVPLVPLAVALSWSLGWDSLTGLGMSLLATGFGFAAGISNPFTIGVAQRIANLPPFSGTGFRAGVFVLVYLILMGFLIRHAKRVERDPQSSPVWEEDAKARAAEGTRDLQSVKSEKAPLIWFVCTMLAILGLIVSASQIPGLSDYSMPLVALLFLIGGLGAGFLARQGWKVFKTFAWGAMGLLPGAVLILMAMSVKYIITSGGIMDTVLHYASETISHTSAAGASLLTYVVVLVLEFFIGSATAKAFLVMPLITPLADLVGITRQVAVLAFAFGDGFSNVLYPTNPVLLIALGLTVVSYPKWFRWVIGLQLAVLILTALLLLVAVAINLGPY